MKTKSTKMMNFIIFEIVILIFFYGSSVSALSSNAINNRLIDMPLVDKPKPISRFTPYEKKVECGSEENLHEGSFSILDYSIVIGMLVISLGIGVFYGFFKKNSSQSSEDYLLGSQMTLFPVTLSLTTSFITAIELLGNPSEMYFYGAQFALIVISCLLVIPVALKFFYPIYFEWNITSCYEFLGIRFGIKLRIFGAVLYILQMVFYTSVAVLAPAIALSKATGLNTHIAVVLTYMVCVFYASQGGMKAVVIADTFQACVLFISLILVLILGHFYTGSAVDVFQSAKENNRLEFFNFDFNPTTRHTVFSIVIGGFFYWTSMFCTNQACVQKCMSLRSLKKAKKGIIFSIIGLVVVFLLNFYTGLMIYKEYEKCDPLKSGKILAKDQLLPFYVMNVYDKIPSITGIFVAGIFAASLGTVASALSSLSAVTTEDILAGFGVKLPSNRSAFFAKWMSLGYGVLSFGLVFVVERLGGILQVTLTLNGLIGGITLGLFLLAIFWKRANSPGALFGGLTALFIVIYIGIMSQFQNTEPIELPSSTESCSCFSNETKAGFEMKLLQENPDDTFPLFRISYMWYSCISSLLTFFLGIIFSFIFDCCFGKKEIEKSMEKEPYENNITDVHDHDKIYIIENEKHKHQLHGKENHAFEEKE